MMKTQKILKHYTTRKPISKDPKTPKHVGSNSTKSDEETFEVQIFAHKQSKTIVQPSQTQAKTTTSSKTAWNEPHNEEKNKSTKKNIYRPNLFFAFSRLRTFVSFLFLPPKAFAQPRLWAVRSFTWSPTPWPATWWWLLWSGSKASSPWKRSPSVAWSGKAWSWWLEEFGEWEMVFGGFLGWFWDVFFVWLERVSIYRWSKLFAKTHNPQQAFPAGLKISNHCWTHFEWLSKWIPSTASIRSNPPNQSKFTLNATRNQETSKPHWW